MLLVEGECSPHSWIILDRHEILPVDSVQTIISLFWFAAFPALHCWGNLQKHSTQEQERCHYDYMPSKYLLSAVYE